MPTISGRWVLVLPRMYHEHRMGSRRINGNQCMAVMFRLSACNRNQVGHILCNPCIVSVLFQV